MASFALISGILGSFKNWGAEIMRHFRSSIETTHVRETSRVCPILVCTPITMPTILQFNL
jgi:hypothetical protein